jgi:outer membrane protein OmpA-like peptidoglycan-associated protein
MVNPDQQLEPLKPDTREGFWGHLNPFARKKYVQRQLSPIRDRTNELDELTAGNSRMLKDVDSRATAGIQRADAHAGLADQHAVDAANRAQAANQTAQQASTHLQGVSQVVENIDQYQSASQVEIRFRPGAATLSKDAKAALDQLAETMKDQKGYVVEVQGFTPGRGATSIQQSQHLADSVVRYLVINHQIPVYRIYELGLGNAKLQTASSDETAKPVHGSRVQVTLMKNGVGELAGQQAPSMSSPQ